MDTQKDIAYKITVADMAPHIHSFAVGENKVNKLYDWLVNWIKLSLECGKIKPYDMMPSKADLACHIGVSQGTVQNVYRLAEDAGYLESKQRVGTFVKDYNKASSLEKLTSKRELAVEIVKKYISENGYQEGDNLISLRKLSQITGISNSTLRLAVNTLAASGILEKRENNFFIKKSGFKIQVIQNQTLVEKIAENLKNYVESNLKPGSRLMSNSELAEIFKVSVKTIHDAVRLLSKEGILYTRRGKYGTYVSGDVNNELYHYEKIEYKIKQYIESKCKEGDKLPSIKAFAEKYNTSGKTVKKALDNLADDGYVMFIRGKRGGTFVTDIPQDGLEAYRWLAINSEYIPNMENGLN